MATYLLTACLGILALGPVRHQVRSPKILKLPCWRDHVYTLWLTAHVSSSVITGQERHLGYSPPQPSDDCPSQQPRKELPHQALLEFLILKSEAK